MSIRVAITDDQASNRHILKNKLLHFPQFEVVLIAENGLDFLEKMKALPDERLPAVALMDLEMTELDGIDAVAAGSYLFPSVKFVVLTIFDDEERIFKAIKAGAFGYLLKDESAENIAGVLVKMHESGIAPISPGIAHKILQLVQNNTVTFPVKVPAKEKSAFNLTKREQEILHLLVQGLLYKEIGDRLQVSPNTAKKHVLNIYSKLHVNTRSQALMMVYQKGII